MDLTDSKLNKITTSYKENTTLDFIRLKLNDNVIYEGIDGQVNIMRLLKCMSINYSVSELSQPLKEPDFEEK